MKFLTLIKAFLLEYKIIVIAIAVIFSVALGSILVSPSSMQEGNAKTLSQKAKTETTDTPSETVTVTPKASPTKKPTATPTPKKTQATATPTNKPTPTLTPTPAFVPVMSGPYVVNGATFSSLYPSVSLKPGDTAVAFRITSTGTQIFDIYDARIFGLNGFSFSPMSGSIQPGETKDILISIDPNATPGTYGGFVGVKVDSGYPSLKLHIIVTVQGNATKSIKVTGPTAGSTFKVGDDITITWEANNISGPFEIGITGTSGSPLHFASSIDNSSRSYTWKATKPSDALDATHFRLRVSGGDIMSHSEHEIIINN